MKKIFYAVLFTFFLFTAGQGIAQNVNSIVYDLYYNLILNPESGDEFIRINHAVFDGNFYSCLAQVQQRAMQAGQQETNRCNGIVDPGKRRACHNNNEAAKIYTWTREIRPCCQGRGLWSQTTIGSSSIVGKREFEKLKVYPPGTWEKIIRQTLPQWRPLFLCQ